MTWVEVASSPVVRPEIAALVTALALTVGACTAGDDAPAPGLSVKDSAGVAVVENIRPLWATEGEPWTVVDSPVVSLGGEGASDSSFVFHVTDVRRLDDGRLLLANGGSSEVRLYTEDGRLTASMGGRGEGPGEYRFLWRAVPMRGDSIAAFDADADRLTILSETGFVGRSVRLPGENLVTVLADGSFLTSDTDARPAGPDAPEGTRVDHVTILHRSTEGELLDSVAGFLLGESFLVRLSERTVAVSTALFAWRSVFAAGEDRLFVVPKGAPEILELDLAGNVRRIVRWREGDRTVRDADVERYVRKRLEEAADSAEVRRRLAERPVADEFPAVSDLLVDDDGYLWAERFERPGGPEGLWMVFSPEGRLLGSVRLPEGFEVDQITRGLVVGVRRDELGVEHVEALPLAGRERPVP